MTDYIVTAEHIGRQIASEAIWYNKACNWIAAQPHNLFTEDNGSFKGTYSSLGPDLYSGTSGVAFFFAELYRSTGHKPFRTMALGAIRCALRCIEQIAPSSRLGLFTGWTGVALAVILLSRALQEEEFLDSGFKILLTVLEKHLNTDAYDLIEGRAGAIIALTLGYEWSNEDRLLEAARRLANELVVRAYKKDNRYSWCDKKDEAGHNLTGFSHGTAGVGFALTRLYGMTNVDMYREGAVGAFNYERYYYDRDAKNWPDFRFVPKGRLKRHQLPFSTFWCHGAPGIAISRIAAFPIIGDEAFAIESSNALITTRDATIRAMESPTRNFSLCHGLCGNGEILAHASTILGNGAWEAIAHDIARLGQTRYEDAGSSWPCGTCSEEIPGLMLGLAGIGMFYLRLANPKIFSFLLLQ